LIIVSANYKLFLYHQHRRCKLIYEYKNNEYHIVEQLQSGKGYWINTSQKGYDITGETLSSYTISLSKGWHLIGTLEGSIKNPFPEECVDEIFRYRNGTYVFVSELLEGNGYWVNLKKD